MEKEKIEFSTIGKFLSDLKNKKGIEKNLSAKKFIEKIIYSLENIKITFKIPQNPQDFAERKSPSPAGRGSGDNQLIKKENSIFPQNEKFVFRYFAPERKHNQTFSITLPNLIHKSKKRNLHR